MGNAKTLTILAAAAMTAGTHGSAAGSQRREGTSMASHQTQTHTNRLSAETSPYLLQHAHNPVDWHPWGPEALRRARDERKPIFLSVGYSSCHWCHVMAHESFEDAETAAILNEHFVSVKVDREERPDIDALYMDSVQLMTGSGGWPLSVFLTPELKPFFGGTYFPPSDAYGKPGFKTVLHRLAEVWESEGDAVSNSAERVTAALRKDPVESGPAPGDIDAGAVRSALESLRGSFDAEWGGFSQAPKFPPSGALALLFREHRRSGEAELLRMALHTLDRMAAGGMYDHVGGGFHRYSVDREWLVPHFEKMLYDNALLSRVYIEAYQVTRRPLYRRTVVGTLDYVLRDMTAAGGGFFSAEDADSEGHEGVFYTWSRRQLDDALGDERAAALGAHYGVTSGGNFEGKNLLHVRGGHPAWAPGATPDPAQDPFAAERETLRKTREKRIRPGTDDKVIAAWNGLMITSLCRAFQVLGEARYRDAAVKSARFILAHMVRDGRLQRTYRAGKAGPPGYLDDYANMVNALVDLYETTFDPGWLHEADRLAAEMLRLFGDDNAAGLYFTASDHELLLTRRRPFVDSSVPSGNAMAALALLRLGELTTRADYRQRAGGILKAGLETARRYPRAGMNLLEAVDLYLAGQREIVLAGDRQSPAIRTMLASVRGTFDPYKVVGFIDPTDPAMAAGLADFPLFTGKTSLGDRPVVYICENNVCKKPLTDPREVARVLSRK